MRPILLPFVAAAALALTACDAGSPIRPLTIKALKLYAAAGGPNVLNVTDGRIATSPGEQFQFSARLLLSNDEESALSSAQWTSSNTNVLTVSETGLVTTIGLGEAQVIGTYLTHTASTTLNVQVE